ncbi:MAG: hypothetical protein QXL15_02895 [Candidatus Korarchaeota archaeon]
MGENEEINRMLSVKLGDISNPKIVEAVGLLERIIKNCDDKELRKYAVAIRYLLIETEATYLREKIADEIITLDPSNHVACAEVFKRIMKGEITKFQDYINRSVELLSNDLELQGLLLKITTFYSLLIVLPFEGPGTNIVEELRGTFIKDVEETLRIVGMGIGDANERKRILGEKLSALLFSAKERLLEEAVHRRLWINDSVIIDLVSAEQLKNIGIDVTLMRSPKLKRFSDIIEQYYTDVKIIVDRFAAQNPTGDFTKYKNIISMLSAALDTLFMLFIINPSEKAIEISSAIYRVLENLLKNIIIKKDENEVIEKLQEFIEEIKSIKNIDEEKIEILGRKLSRF